MLSYQATFCSSGVIQVTCVETHKLKNKRTKIFNFIFPHQKRLIIDQCREVNKTISKGHRSLHVKNSFVCGFVRRRRQLFYLKFPSCVTQDITQFRFITCSSLDLNNVRQGMKLKMIEYRLCVLMFQIMFMTNIITTTDSLG